MSAAPADVARLELHAEDKVAHLLAGCGAGERLEASGVVAVGGLLYVIFDNTSRIARLDAGLDRRGAVNAFLEHARMDDEGYEDIAYDPESARFFVLIEALQRDHDCCAKVREYDLDRGCVSSGWLDFPLREPNKGLEGLTCVRRDDGELYLLGLCEGNKCKGGADGRIAGHGRIQVFAREEGDYEHVGTIRLPESLWFEDFSSLAIHGDRLCVLSQESSALWVGRLSPTAWEVVDDGKTFLFPTAADERTVYCNLEGVSWVDDHHVVVVSDRMKKDTQDACCAEKDQSVHLFGIPDAGAPSQLRL
jgi:hypothetical protein